MLHTCVATNFLSRWAIQIINFIEALVFGLFVIIMMFDQFSAIFEIADEYEAEFGIYKSRFTSRFTFISRAVFSMCYFDFVAIFNEHP